MHNVNRRMPEGWNLLKVFDDSQKTRSSERTYEPQIIPSKNQARINTNTTIHTVRGDMCFKEVHDDSPWFAHSVNQGLSQGYTYCYLLRINENEYSPQILARSRDKYQMSIHTRVYSPLFIDATNWLQWESILTFLFSCSKYHFFQESRGYTSLFARMNREHDKCEWVLICVLRIWQYSRRKVIFWAPGKGGENTSSS